MHPKMLDDVSRMIADEVDDPIGLLIFASSIRDELPWVYEVVVEVYRDIRSGNVDAAERAVERLRRTAKALRRSPFVEDFASGPESHMLIMELPKMLERLLPALVSSKE